jgi:hypothetical protein
MKKSLLNRCKNCGHTWFPRGFDLSRKCPSCDGEDIDFTGRFYLVILIALTVCAGIFWATDRPHRTAKAATPLPVTPARYMKPRLADVRPRLVDKVAPEAEAPIVPAKITTEAEGRIEALRLYPELGVANSPLNREFVARYRSYQRLQPDFFQEPAWPVILVRESAAALGDRSPTQ